MVCKEVCQTARTRRSKCNDKDKQVRGTHRFLPIPVGGQVRDLNACCLGVFTCRAEFGHELIGGVGDSSGCRKGFGSFRCVYVITRVLGVLDCGSAASQHAELIKGAAELGADDVLDRDVVPR